MVQTIKGEKRDTSLISERVKGVVEQVPESCGLVVQWSSDRVAGGQWQKGHKRADG